MTMKHQQKKHGALSLLLLLLSSLLLVWTSSCFSASAPTKHMNRKARTRALNSIWHYTQHGRQNPDQALRLLERLLREEQETEHQVLKQGVVWNVLRSCHRAPQPPSDSCLNRLESTLTLLEENPRLYHVNMTEFVLTTLANNGKPEQAKALLDKHTNVLLKTSPWNETLLGTTKNAIWFHIHKNPDRPQGAENALLLVERLLEQDSHAVTKGMVFNVLRACQQHPGCNVNVLEHLLALLEQRNLLDAKILTEVLVSMTKSPAQDAVRRAEVMLRNSSLQSNPYHYCAVLNGYAKRGEAKKAERLLQSMSDKGIAVTTVAYNCVLDALSKCNEPKAVERAEQVLKKMNHDDRTSPDMVSYANMLSLYAKQTMGDKAEALLEQVIELEDAGKLKQGPSDYSYRCVIDALAKSGQAERAEDILNRMRKRNSVPNKFHYCGVLNGYAREGRPMEAERLLAQMQETGDVAPNAVAFNCVMYAWAKSGEVDAPFRARAVVDRMIETGVAPNLITYNCLLCACAHRAMPRESEKLLKQMNEMHESGELDAAPNKISYNYVLDSLARSGDRVWTVLRAESLINRMKELYTSGEANTKPDMITYRCLLKCYANWNLPQDAEQLLHRMQELYEKGELEYGPDRVSYQVVIDALGKADDDDARKRAAVLKKQVKERYGKRSWKQETIIDVVDQMDALLEYMSA